VICDSGVVLVGISEEIDTRITTVGTVKA
jgi:hypothetical protein